MRMHLRKRNSFIILIITVALANLALLTWPTFMTYGQSGANVENIGSLKVVLVGALTAVMMTLFTAGLGFAIGSLINLIPFGNKSYKERFQKTVLLSILVVLVASVIFMTIALFL